MRQGAAGAPWISKYRVWQSSCLKMPKSLVLPPVNLWRGARPGDAANSLLFEKSPGLIEKSRARFDVSLSDTVNAF